MACGRYIVTTASLSRLRIDLPNALANALARDLTLPQLPEFLAAQPLLEVGIRTTTELDRRRGHAASGAAVPVSDMDC